MVVIIETCKRRETFKVPIARNFFLRNFKIYYLKYTIPKFEWSTTKTVDLTSAESLEILPSKMVGGLGQKLIPKSQL